MEDVRLNVSVWFSWVIAPPQSDKATAQWIGITAAVPLSLSAVLQGKARRWTHFLHPSPPQHNPKTPTWPFTIKLCSDTKCQHFTTRICV